MYYDDPFFEDWNGTKEQGQWFAPSEAVIMKFCSKKDEANYELFPTKKTRSRPRCNVSYTKKIKL